MAAVYRSENEIIFPITSVFDLKKTEEILEEIKKELSDKIKEEVSNG